MHKSQIRGMNLTLEHHMQLSRNLLQFITQINNLQKRVQIPEAIRSHITMTSSHTPRSKGSGSHSRRRHAWERAIERHIPEVVELIGRSRK